MGDRLRKAWLILHDGLTWKIVALLALLVVAFLAADDVMPDALRGLHAVKAAIFAMTSATALCIDSVKLRTASKPQQAKVVSHRHAIVRCVHYPNRIDNGSGGRLCVALLRGR